MTTAAPLAIDGGKPVRNAPMPARALIGAAERQAAMAVFDEAIASGEAFGYNGPWEQRYEQAFCEFMGGGYADGVNSGTNAVYVALGALNLDPFSEVIVPPITDPGGIMPVPLLGCIPIVADSDPDTYNTSAEQLAPLITPRTRALIVAHICGDMVDMDPVMDLARRHGLAVIEDCAQAHGAEDHGRKAGTMGHVAAFSTMSGKHHCTGAQGGVVYTRDEALAGRIKRFADRGKPFGLENAGGNVTAGLNCNLNELAAAIGLTQIRRLPEILARRRHIGETLKRGMAGLRAVAVGRQTPESRSVYWFLRIRFDPEAVRVDKQQFCAALSAEGLPVTPSYGHFAPDMPWFRNQSVFGSNGFPWTAQEYTGARKPCFRLDNARRTVATHFNIAIHEQYGDRDIADILTALEKVETAYRR